MTRSEVAKSTPRGASSVVDRKGAHGRAPLRGSSSVLGATHLIESSRQTLAAANATSCC